MWKSVLVQMYNMPDQDAGQVSAKLHWIVEQIAFLVVDEVVQPALGTWGTHLVLLLGSPVSLVKPLQTIWNSGRSHFYHELH